MEFNSIIFPTPKFNYNMLEYYKDELIFIPKAKDKIDYIPCLFIRDYNSQTKNIIIMFQGNAEDIFGARNMGEALCQKLHMNIILVEYPGYSIYKQDPSTDELLQNTTIIYDYIKEKFRLKDKNIFIFGRSIGTSPAIYLASKRKPKALINISAFTSIKAVAENLVGFLKILVKDRLISIDYIKNVTCPILFIHGQKDPLIPFKETIILKDNCDCPFEVVLPIDMTHNDFDLDTDIMEPIDKFISKNCNIDKQKNKFDDNEEIKKLFEIPKVIKDY
jgi:esterase/lipase